MSMLRVFLWGLGTSRRVPVTLSLWETAASVSRVPVQWRIWCVEEKIISATAELGSLCLIEEIRVTEKVRKKHFGILK